MRETDAASSMELTQEDIVYREEGRWLNLISFSLSSKNLNAPIFVFIEEYHVIFMYGYIMYHVWVRMIIGF